MEYKEVRRIKVGKGYRAFYDASTEDIVIAKELPDPEPQEVDVTAECTAEIRKSKSSAGHYVGICHEGKVIFALGVDDKSKFVPFTAGGGYRIEHIPDAAVSFKITKKVRHGSH